MPDGTTRTSTDHTTTRQPERHYQSPRRIERHRGGYSSPCSVPIRDEAAFRQEPKPRPVLEEPRSPHLHDASFTAPCSVPCSPPDQVVV